jgi:hypothetical protein
MHRVIVAAGLLVATTGASPADTTSSVRVGGAYTSNWGPVVLHQHGTRITGEYEFDHGRDGVLDGNMIRYAWHEQSGDGRGVFVAASDGELIGTWGGSDDDTNGGGWRLVPDKSAAIAR